MRLLACLATLCLTASVALATPPQAEARAGANPGARAVADHVTDGECLACHADQARLWTGSKHELAMQPATPDTVLGDFADARFAGTGEAAHFLRRGDAFHVATEGADGQRAELPVTHTFGIRPLQQVLLPQPGGLDYRVIAATFLRHPILRLGSIYRYKRGSGDGTVTAALASAHDFAGWIAASFPVRTELTHMSNPQTRYFAGVYGRQAQVRVEPGLLTYDLVTAERNLANVELLGRTEYFDADLTRFVGIAARYGLALTIPEVTHHNATERSAAPVAERVEALLSQLPGALRDRLLAANQQDLALYAMAERLIGATR